MRRDFQRLERQLCDALRASMMTGAAPIVPEAGRLYWRMFIDLSSARTWSAAGPNPIAWSEIDAWARLRRWPVRNRHINVLRAMDRIWLECARSNGSGGSRPVAEATPAALDAAFDAAGWG